MTLQSRLKPHPSQGLVSLWYTSCSINWLNISTYGPTLDKGNCFMHAFKMKPAYVWNLKEKDTKGRKRKARRTKQPESLQMTHGTESVWEQFKKKRQTICLGSSFYNPVTCYTSKTWREETLRKRSTWGMKETKLKQEERCVVTDVKEEDVRLCLVSNLLKSLIYKSCSVKYQCFTSRLTNILELTKQEILSWKYKLDKKWKDNWNKNLLKKFDQ